MARKEVTDGLISDLLETSFNRVVMISKLQGVEEWIDIEEMEKVTINYSFEFFFWQNERKQIAAGQRQMMFECGEHVHRL